MAETALNQTDLIKLIGTIPAYNKEGLLQSLKNTVLLYGELRIVLFDHNVILHDHTAQKVMYYFDIIEQGN